MRLSQLSALWFLLLAAPRTGRCLTLTAELQAFVSTFERYAKEKNDIVFVLDESGSIGAENFPAELTFTEMTARLLVVSPEFSRLTVVTYSNDNMKHIDQIAYGGTMCSFVHEVNKIGYRTGGTRTREALEYAGRLLENARSDANRIIVLISDGQANSGSEPNYIAAQLKSQGIIIFAVGVASINRAELEAVASSPNHIYMLVNFPYIKEVNNDLRKDIKESQWDQALSDQCTENCDANAVCACGAQSGTHRCVCKAGYQGDGTVGKCQRCPRGTYKERTGSHMCLSCMSNSTTKSEGSTSANQCSCLPGYEGYPGSRIPCSPIKCAPLSDPPGGKSVPRPCGNRFGSKCHFFCDVGHCPYRCDRAQLAAGRMPWNRKSKEPRTCEADKTWSGPEFYCEKVRCPALQPPGNGSLTCSSGSLEFNTTCTAGCNTGYNMRGDPHLSCGIDGQWRGAMPKCEVATCPPLKANTKLQVNPSHCKNREATYGKLCLYECKAGWRLVDTTTQTSADGVRRCQADGTWLNAKQAITCKDAEPPVIEDCPRDVTFPNAPGSAFSEQVSWAEPKAVDNSGSAIVELVSPAGITGLPHAFQIGEHEISYVARDAEGLSSDRCTFKVFVLDEEKPAVTYCPPDIVTYFEKRSKNVTWEEPKFSDNDPRELKVTTDRRPGSSFSWGPPSLVTYQARDAADNSATCSFNVIVKPYPCAYVPPPKNGFVTCDSETERQYCSVYCDKGYHFVFKPEPLYRCKQTPQGGSWTTFQRNQKFKFPWPDCAVASQSKKTDFGIDFKFATNSCQISDAQKEALKKKFFEKLFNRLRNYPGMCEASRGCTVDNVAIDCKPKKALDSTPRVHRRDIARQQARIPRDLFEGFDLKVSFVIPVDADFNATQLLDGCEECRNETLVHPSAAETTALTRHLEDSLSEAINSTVAELLPDASLVGTAHSINSVCPRGQVSNERLCVNCPVGTFYHNTTTCLPCPVGTYSDKEAAKSCVSCPANKTTLVEKASSVSECKALCEPGTWSYTGKEPCMTCGPDSYQDGIGETSCKKCAAGLSTGKWGANSSSDCQDVCPPGSYSRNGLKPCSPCPRGKYQPSKNQTSCLSCDDGLSTHVVGTVAKSGCVALNLCSTLNPCGNGSTCVDLTHGFQCNCPEGLSGVNCEQNADDCAPGLCQNGGTCVDGINSFTCLCPSGYTGSACELNMDDCASNPCQNGATCIDGVNKFACKCPKGFTGKRCEAIYHDCSTRPCLNGGSCFESLKGFRCCCPKGFSGKTCEVVDHACRPNPCLNNGTCVKKDDSFECVCPHGYEGRTCETNVDDCASDPCLNGGTCVDGLASFTCRCQGPYTGATCAAVLPSNFTLHFPNASVLNFAKVAVKRYLRAVTLSFHMKTTQTKERGTVASYAFVHPSTVELQDNALTISDPNKLLLYIFGESYDTQTVANDGQWHHCAVTWDSLDGQWVFYWDQEEKIKGVKAAGEYLFEGMLVVGQDQDDVGGDFSGIEAYSGHVAELNMWDYAMSPEEVKQLSGACRLAGNVVSWPEVRASATAGIVSDGHDELCAGGAVNNKLETSCHSVESSFDDRMSCSRSVTSCSSNPCQNGQPCVENDDGSSECVCDESYEGKFCQYDVDECLTGKHNCSDICINTAGSYKCDCPEGTFLGNDSSTTCLDASYCEDDLSAYGDGDSWERGCESCTCDKGVISCSPLACPPLNCEEGEVLFQKPSQCCASCIKEPPQCVLLGNKTLTSFDGLSFTLSKQREYTLFQDCHDGNFYGYVAVSESQVVVRVYIHCLTASLFANGRAEVDGRAVQLPHSEGSVMSLRDCGDCVELRTHHGIVVKVHSNGAVETSLPDGFAGRVCGLCGNANGDVLDDLSTRYHISAKGVEEFLESWRVPKPSLKQKYPACRQRKHYETKHIFSVCRMLKSDSLQKCYKRLKNPRPFFEDCVEQMCSCYGSRGVYCYCDAFAAFKLACEQHNIHFSHLPGKSCESKCPEGMEFRTCGPVRMPRCSHADNVTIGGACSPGCFCPEGHVLHKGKCISKGDCPFTPSRLIG